ncbi:hypothetical protein AB1Y20_000567 [Prymnesium parvum]|uniref:Uncharacterized protein n=1 Tax=Prymnesium parvum TaxID=97485 RepID=A0AB34K679_PRYPA
MDCSVGTLASTFFIVFSSPFSGADAFCRLLNRHPDIKCSGELFSPHSAAAAEERLALGIPLDRQRADPAAFLRRHFARCAARACGVVVMPYQLGAAQLPQLFLPACDVHKLIFERTNLTAEFLSFRRANDRPPVVPSASPPPSSARVGWRDMSFERYAKLHRAWFAQVGKLAPAARSLSLRAEQLQLRAAEAPATAAAARCADRADARRAAPARAASSTRARHAEPPRVALDQEDALCSTYALLGVAEERQLCLFDSCRSAELRNKSSYTTRWAGFATTGAASAAPQKGTRHAAASRADGAPSSISLEGASRPRGRQVAVAIVGVSSFVIVTVAGICLALGIAIGQRTQGSGQPSGRKVAQVQSE